MDENNKKIIIGVLKLLLFGAFCKVGFDATMYMSIGDTIDTAKEVVFLAIILLLLIIVLVTVVATVNKSKNMDKVRKQNNQVDMLESQMMSTTGGRNNTQRQNNTNVQRQNNINTQNNMQRQTNRGQLR